MGGHEQAAALDGAPEAALALGEGDDLGAVAVGLDAHAVADGELGAIAQRAAADAGAVVVAEDRRAHAVDLDHGAVEALGLAHEGAEVGQAAREASSGAPEASSAWLSAPSRRETRVGPS